MDNSTKEKSLKKGWILTALMLTMALAAMDITIVSTAIPQIVASLGGFQKFTWVFSIYLLAQTITIPIYGKLSDLYGRKKILIFGIIVFIIGSMTSGFAWNINSLILFRGLQGLGAGSILATVNTIAGDIYTVKERAKIQGYLSSIWGISAIVGPSLGGALATYINWRWIFFINLPIAALSLSFLLLFFHEKVEKKESKIDYKGSILIMLTLSLFLIFLLESGQRWAWISWQSISLLLSIILLTIVTYFVEKNQEHAILPLHLMKNRTLAFSNIAMVGMGLVLMGPETFLPTFGQAALGLSIIASGFVLASMSIGWPTASTLSGQIYLKIGFRNTAMIGAFLILFSILFFLMIPRPQAVYLVVINQILLGAGFGFLSTPTLVGAQSLVDWHQRGVVTSSIIFTRNLGQSVGATLYGAIFNYSLLKKVESRSDLGAINLENLITKIHDNNTSETIKLFLQDAVNYAMRNVYFSMLIFTIIIILAVSQISKKHKAIEL